MIGGGRGGGVQKSYSRKLPLQGYVKIVYGPSYAVRTILGFKVAAILLLSILLHILRIHALYTVKGVKETRV